MATDTQRLQQALHAAQARGILPAGAALPEDESPSWVVLVLSLLGAQLVVWPALLFLGFRVTGFSCPQVFRRDKSRLRFSFLESFS